MIESLATARQHRFGSDPLSESVRLRSPNILYGPTETSTLTANGDQFIPSMAQHTWSIFSTAYCIPHSLNSCQTLMTLSWLSPLIAGMLSTPLLEPNCMMFYTKAVKHTLLSPRMLVTTCPSVGTFYMGTSVPTMEYWANSGTMLKWKHS